MSELEFLQDGLPFIRNDCTRPPHHLIKHLKESLRQFSEEELRGLGAIWLYDQMPNQWAEEFQEMISKGGRLWGVYQSETTEFSSYIVLFIDDIYRGLENFPFIEYTSIPTLCIIGTLAHEIAHHLIATRGYAFEPGEDVSNEELLANQYAQKHLEKMSTRWRHRFGFWLMKHLAELHYSTGVVYSTKHRYCEAADSLYKAWYLNPKLENVSEWYHLAREKCNSRKESSSVKTS